MNRITCVAVVLCCIITKSFGQYSHFNKAKWISPGYTENSSMRPCPVFQKSFTAKGKIRSATLYITAHGLYEAAINNRRVGDAYFTPGFTAYNKRLQYQQYDVTDLIGARTEIKVTLGDGWWRGVFGGDMKTNRYSSDASLLFQLEISYADGSREVVASDSSWQCGTGPLQYADLYAGSLTDTRITGAGWEKVAVKDFPLSNLVPTISEPVTRQETFRPVAIKNNTIDFGQNLAGWVQIKVKGKPGDTIRIEHAEALDKDGNFYTGNLREAKATDIYILNGKEQTLEPKFTYHGFRYAKVEGFAPTKNNCLAIAVHSNLRHTGSFTCSNLLINRLQQNIEWSLNSNFFDIPTDCPQRSERLGWTGDAQVFCRTAAFNRNVRLFFTRWLADLKADQGENGAVPTIIPDIYHFRDSAKRTAAGWGDAATIIPWTLFEVYDDTAMLRAQYSSMKAWVDYMNNSSTNYLWKANGYGDWYATGKLNTPVDYIDECFFAYSTSLLVKAAAVLQNKEDVEKYTGLLQHIKEAFKKEYAVTPPTQTAYVLGLEFGLLPDSAARTLVSLIHQNNDHLSTGFLGTPYILNVLSRYGYTGLAYTLLNQTTPPSWLYPITKGATTIWEKWDAIKPDGTFDTCSLNHYAYGAVGDWLYRTVAGIDALEPGYRKIKIAPQPGGGLTWAKAAYRCPYGLIESGWKIKNAYLTMKVSLPTDAEIHRPDGRVIQVGPGKYTYKMKWNSTPAP